MLDRTRARVAQVICFLGAVSLLHTVVASAATYPISGFTERLIASGLSSPTAMQFAPDGRLFVCEQGGRLRVIKDGTLLSTPFATVSTTSSGERGLLGVAFDPNFAVNHYVYVYYTVPTAPIHNRISRFTANGDVAAGGETIIFELDNLSSATNHNGGALAFGPDGKLYAAVGENATSSNAQSLANVLGKMLRINADGSIPTDNPFYGTATGRNRAIWALGLRNPFTFAFHPNGSRMFINDVGQGTWEEVNDGIAGANYGWPTTEGATTDPRFQSPLYTYNHTGGVCAITGGAFYSPDTVQYPSDYVGDYFFADYCGGWIRKIESTGGGLVTLATGITSPVDLKVSDDGSLYYLARGSGSGTGVVYRIEYGNPAPTITEHPISRTVAPGASVTFSVRATGAATLRYQWQRNNVNISGATSQDYTIASVTTTDNGAQFRAVVSNTFGSANSNPATLTVTANRAPTASITQPVSGTLYTAGTTINYAGTGTDPEDGTLPASAFTWWVDFHHDTHTHPAVQPTTGARSGSFTIPTTGETSANVWYRIHLRVRDSAGALHETQRDVMPRTVTLSLATSPASLGLRLDGQPISTPASVPSVVGIVRNIDAPLTQTVGATTYEFVSWSDGGAAAHNVSTPAANTTYTATYRAVAGGANGLSATYFNNSDFTGTSISRVDPIVDFTWGSGAPDAAIAADTFSVRWTGQVQPQFTETYTFYTVSDDGVRLWVNGQQLVNHWNNHAAFEDRGTIQLTAGQRYDIRMEFYDNTGSATARLLWSSPSTPKAVVPSARLFPVAAPTGPIRINFQPSGAVVPSGFLADTGLTFASRGNGYSYGWNASNSAQARERNSALSPDQAYDTLIHTQKSGNTNAVWEIAVPNGTYSVRIVAGDADYFDSVFRIAAEGVLTVSGTPTTTTRWIEGTSTVTVSDGRLTLTNASGASNNKVCFVVITRQ